MKKAILAMLTGLLMTAAAYAQGGPPPGPRGPGPRGGFGPGFGFAMRPGKVVTGAPYQADMSNVSVRTLSDGNTIQQTTTGHVARDSQGRTYEQSTTTGGPMGQGTMTFITDPVAGYAYTLNSQNNTAVRHAIKTPPAGAGNWQGRTGGPRGNARANVNHVENDLGTQNVNGVSAQGKSVTDTTPAGAVGNTQPIVSTRETWYSPALQIPVMAKRNDPRAGQSTFTLTNIQTGDPPASLFQVPANYTVTDAPARGQWRGGPPPGNPQ